MRKRVDFKIFIDTNILLDLYRVRGREAGLSILKHIDDHLDRFITTNQVEMEFKKNRQRVIVESHGVFKLPNFEGLQLPVFVSESKQSKALERHQKALRDHATTLRDRMSEILKNPTTHDPVFKTAQRLFRAESDFNLSREKKIRFTIRNLARKRFILGYPPRKNSDTSIGDAINWEWVVHCAKQFACHVVIVTRDSDYGVSFDKKPILNDWLATEFRERVSKKRKLLLTDRLSTALKLARIPVTQKEVAAEQELITARRRSQATGVDLMQALRSSLARVEMARIRKQLSEPYVASLDPDDFEPPDPEDIEPPDPEDIEPLDPEDIEPPDPEDIEPPDPEAIEPPDPEDIEPSDPEDLEPDGDPEPPEEPDPDDL